MDKETTEAAVMSLKPDVIRALEREKAICELAVSRLRERCRELEEKYGCTTREFQQRFNAGEMGDEQDLFVWHSLVEAQKDWQETCDHLEELLDAPETASA
jgi:hypothetical protein